MDVFPITHMNGRSSRNPHLMEMVEEIRVGTDNMDVTVSSPDRLPRHPCETVVVPFIAFFGELGATNELMHVSLSGYCNTLPLQPPVEVLRCFFSNHEEYLLSIGTELSYDRRDRQVLDCLPNILKKGDHSV